MSTCLKNINNKTQISHLLGEYFIVTYSLNIDKLWFSITVTQ